ncbi:uncharacterized protein LOC109859130 [Pseudomyrmex gracilis]|uniref:uncharacterized protein LOC109859130 n=1 Tax=Pseudomyrmex gracilis TaxID=219809 RepID=UPI000994E6E3|nr:uncharacterized protein LOC109859130 [Pseudomyrmex gracilis]
MLRVITRQVLLQRVTIIPLRTFSQHGASQSNQSTVVTNVQGLSENIVKVPNTPVGPDASKDKEYKNPEYFCYHVDSFGEAEVELAKFRLPAPSNKRPFLK